MEDTPISAIPQWMSVENHSADYKTWLAHNENHYYDTVRDICADFEANGKHVYGLSVQYDDKCRQNVDEAFTHLKNKLAHTGFPCTLDAKKSFSATVWDYSKQRVMRDCAELANRIHTETAIVDENGAWMERNRWAYNKSVRGICLDFMAKGKGHFGLAAGSPQRRNLDEAFARLTTELCPIDFPCTRGTKRDLCEILWKRTAKIRHKNRMNLNRMKCVDRLQLPTDYTVSTDEGVRKTPQPLTGCIKIIVGGEREKVKQDVQLLVPKADLGMNVGDSTCFANDEGWRKPNANNGICYQCKTFYVT